MTDSTEVASLPSIVNCAFVPVCTRERFAHFSGLDEGVIRGMCDRGYLPTIKLGKYSLINLVALIQECDQAKEVAP